MVQAIPLLVRKETHFVLWRPAHVRPVPRLRIGTYGANGLENQQEQDLVRSDDWPDDLWELKASDVSPSLMNDKVYHYWFLVKDDFPDPKSKRSGLGPFAVTDPFATTVDRRLMSEPPIPPYEKEDADPAAVILYRNGKLIPCDPDGEEPKWNGDGELKNLPRNSQLVIYELPTRWALKEKDKEDGIGTFQDVLALVDGGASDNGGPSGANFRGSSFLHGSYLSRLGINALELLPPEDSFQVQQWGYGTSNFLSADYDLGKPGDPEGPSAPTASKDFGALVAACHRFGIRFFLDVVMAFATHAPYENINYHGFHEPDKPGRQAFGGALMKYFHPVDGYDPLTGKRSNITPSRQWMKVFLTHWMQHYRVDGIRMDSVVNFDSWDFIKEYNDLARDIWRQRWKAKYGAGSADDACDARFLVVAEELAVPIDLVRQNKADSLWNDHFKKDIRNAILGGPGSDNDSFRQLIERTIDCRKWGFQKGSEAVNYITSHDVANEKETRGSVRLYNFLQDRNLDPARPGDQGKRLKLAHVCLLTAVGIPMILAGEEFADKMDLRIDDPKDPNELNKQIDPINWNRLERDKWRQDVFEYVASLVKFRTKSKALSMDHTRFIHWDLQPNRRIVAWVRGRGSEQVVVVANFSGWGTENPRNPHSEYKVTGWPALASGMKWHEVTDDRPVPPQWAGREPIYPWEAKVYAMVSA